MMMTKNNKNPLRTVHLPAIRLNCRIETVNSPTADPNLMSDRFLRDAVSETFFNFLPCITFFPISYPRLDCIIPFSLPLTPL
jgi:hypothetical protein